MIGNYIYKGSDFTYSLQINSDSTFELRKHYYETPGRCKGKWRFLNNNLLELSCFDGDLAERLTRGYMSKRIDTVAVSRNRITLNGIPMRRVK